MRVVAINPTHDSSLCSILDGKIEYYCKEERLSRVKRDKNPFLCLNDFHKKNFGEIDHFLLVSPTTDINYYNLYYEYVRKMFGVELEDFSDLTHHICHASCAFYNSGFDNALVFVIDRCGSSFTRNDLNREVESVYEFSYPDKVNTIYKSFSCSNPRFEHKLKEELKKVYESEINITNEYGIVKVYESATTLIGQNVLENGKTMGLSSYGEDKNYEPLFINGGSIERYFSMIDAQNNGFLSCCFSDYEDKITKKITKDNYKFYANTAKHVQIETQKEVLRLIKKYVNETNIKNVCISGGYGLNVVANNFYIKNLPDVNFYFEPLSDDSGTSIGGAMLKYRCETKSKKIHKLSNNFYHTYSESDNEILGDYTTIDNLIDFLENQYIIAVFNGNPESGPRALGHRSIIFDPRNIDGKKIINTIKKREWYRPFGGIILESHFDNYFYTLGIKKSKFMTINFECKESIKEYVPSIVHVDNTCRIQTVSEEDGFIFDLLTRFYEKTNCPMLLNTSFNMAGKPLVHTKNDAIEFLEEVQGNAHFGGIYFADTQTILKN